MNQSGVSPMDYTINAMSPADYEAALALWKSSDGIGLNESDSVEAIAQFLERNPGLSLVARNPAGQLVGAVLCGHDGRRGYLYHLAVAEDHRLQRVGIRLVEECLARLQALRIPRCNIFVYAANEDGKKFWTRHGWEERHEMHMMQKFLRDT